MKLKLLLGKMFPTIAKDALVDYTIQFSETTRGTTIPIVSIVGVEVSDAKTLPKRIQENNEHYQKKYRTDYYSTALAAVKNIVEISDYIEIALNDKFNEDITRTAMSLYHATIVRLINILGFVSDYARRLAVIHMVELDYANNPKGNKDDFHLTPAEEKYLAEYKWAYFAAINIFSQPVKSLIDKLEALPDIVINEDNVDVVSATTNTDPLQMNFIVHPLNPVIFVGTRINIYQAKKYKQAQADLQEVQALLHRMNMSRNGENDAKTDKAIEYYSNLSMKLKAEIQRMEKEYDIK